MWATNQSKPLPQVRASVGLTPSPGMHGMHRTQDTYMKSWVWKIFLFFHKAYLCAHLGKNLEMVLCISLK